MFSLTTTGATPDPFTGLTPEQQAAVRAYGKKKTIGGLLLGALGGAILIVAAMHVADRKAIDRPVRR